MLQEKVRTIFSLIVVLFGFHCLPAQVGTPAPNFTVTDTHGETHTLYEYLDSGKIIVLDFFFTTCLPCQFYSPQVNLAYEKYGCNTQDVVFIAIDYNDTNAEVLIYDDSFNIQYPSISGLEGGGNQVVQDYGVSGFPTFYVIDSTRMIIEEIDPPTLQVFDFRFSQLGIEPMECLTVSAEEQNVLDEVKVYPNPVSGGVVYVELPGGFGEFEFELVGIEGRFVKRGILLSGADGIGKIELGGVGPGIYIMKLSQGDERKKILLSRL